MVVLYKSNGSVIWYGCFPLHRSPGCTTATTTHLLSALCPRSLRSPELDQTRANHVIHSIFPFRVSAISIWSSVTFCGAKIPIPLTKMSLLWHATPPPITIIFNFALFQRLLFPLLYPPKERALIYLVLWWRGSAAKVVGFDLSSLGVPNHSWLEC